MKIILKFEIFLSNYHQKLLNFLLAKANHQKESLNNHPKKQVNCKGCVKLLVVWKLVEETKRWRMSLSLDLGDERNWKTGCYKISLMFILDVSDSFLDRSQKEENVTWFLFRQWRNVPFL